MWFGSEMWSLCREFGTAMLCFLFPRRSIGSFSTYFQCYVFLKGALLVHSIMVPQEWMYQLPCQKFLQSLIDLLCLGCWVCSDYEIQGPVRNVVGQNLGFPFWLFPFQDFLFFFRGHGLPGFGLLVFQAIKATVLFVYFFVLVPLPLLMPQCLGPG